MLEVIAQLGYVPDGAAQSMARRRKEVVGLVMIENRGPETEVEQEGLLFIDEVLRGVETALADVGWSVLIAVVHEGSPSARRQPEATVLRRRSTGGSRRGGAPPGL